MRKSLKLFSKKGICLILAIIMIALCFAPISSVLATSYGTGDKHLNIDITRGDFNLKEVTVNGETWEGPSDEYRTTDGQYTVIITVEKNGDTIPDIQYGGNWSDCIVKNNNVSADGNTYTYTLTIDKPEDEQYNFLALDIIQMQGQQGNPEGGDQPGGDPQEPGGDQPGERTSLVDFGTAEWEIDGVTVSVVIPNIGKPNNGPVELEIRDQFRVSNFDPSTMEMIISTDEGFNARLSLIPDTDHETTLDTSDAEGGLPNSVKFSVVKKQNGGEQGGDNNQYNGPKENIEFDIKFTNTHVFVWINGFEVVDVPANSDDTQFKGTVNEVGATDPELSNVIRFQTEFGDLPVTEYTINGQVYKEGDPGVTVNEDGFFVTVPGAEKYTITGEGNENAVVERTVIWTNPNYVPTDAEDEEWIQEFKLENGYAYVIAVYDANGNLIPVEDYKSENWEVNENGGGVGSNGFGWIAVYAGSRVVFEFVPEYGYQLTDIRINGQKLGISETMNQFEFIMPNANIHFDAEFTKTSDILKANSEKVTGGSISLGKNELDGGSAQLTVSDVELSADKIEGFENAAGDYLISNYLDIDLYQVFYKGKNDSDDVWSYKIDELNNEVTITIKLADGVDGNDIVIVHNIHDGDKYEIIKIDSYDSQTNTITFRTKSFSNYAIAAKETKSSEDSKNESENKAGNKAENETESPQTGDKILMITGILAVATVGIVITSKKRRNK